MDIVGELPVELGQLILSYLKPKDLCRVSGVNVRWRELTNGNWIWKRLCAREGWTTLDMVVGFKSHLPPILLTKEVGSLVKLCSWRINYERHRGLPINWEKNKSARYRLSDPRDSPVSCLHSDGTLLLMGRDNGVVSVLNIETLPKFHTEFQALLDSRILQAKIFGDFCIVQQHMLLQFFSLKTGFIDSKSFDFGFAFIEFSLRTKWKPKTFKSRYKPSPMKDLFVEWHAHRVYASVRDYQCVFVWDETGRRTGAVHVTNRMCKMRDMCIQNGCLFVIYAASRRIRHIAVYDLNEEKWMYEVTTPRCKTQKLFPANSLLIGVAVAGPALTCVGVILAWERSNGKLISERHTEEYICSRTVTTSYELVLYAETTSITLWEPRSNSVLRKVSTVGNPLYIQNLQFTFIAVYTDRYAYVWDWFTGSRCFRLLSVYNTFSTDFIWSNETAIILKTEEDLVEMIGFC